MYSQPAIFTITRFPINIQRSNKITKTKNTWILSPPPKKETLGVKDLGVQNT
jgi:hypothetical protein